MISIIVAMAHHNVIGQSNDLPWYLPADLQHFKKITVDHTVIMGRKTFDSIHKRLGKPLPGRKNIIVTRNTEYIAGGAEVVHSLEQALQLNEHSELFIIGGAELYEQTLPLTKKLYITHVNADIEGDTYFPALNDKAWLRVSHEPHNKDDKNTYDYSFDVYERIV